MKKILLEKFKHAIISRERSKSVKGGYGENCGTTCSGSVSTCTFSKSCGAGAILTGGNCGSGCYAAYQ